MVDLVKTEEDLVGSDVRLKDTKIYDKLKKDIYTGGFLDGLFTLIGSIVPIIPFIFAPVTITLENAVYLSIAVTLALLFILGIYLGKLSRENMIILGTKMALFGLVTAAVASSLTFFL